MNKNACHWFQENAFENEVCETAVIVFMSQCIIRGYIKSLRPSELTNIASDNGLSPRRRQAII